MDLIPHLNFNGECEAAFKYYEELFGGKIKFIMKYEESPAANKVEPGWQKKIIHARLALGGQGFMGCDAPESCYEKPAGFSVSLQIKDPPEAERIFHALAHGGTVKTPLQQTFWAERFGMATDRFGIPRMVNCERAAVPAVRETSQAAAQ